MVPTFAELISQGTLHAWLFVPSAILLGALHGLEPGHSKTMMAAFIVAIRGTVTQAVMLGLAATASHTFIVWIIALGGLYLWHGLDAEHLEPYFQLASAAIIIAIALWMLWRTWRDQQRARAAAGAHGHHHADDDARRIDTGHGTIAIEIFRQGAPPRWRIRTESGRAWNPAEVSITTERPDGTVQRFGFVQHGPYLESVDTVPGPHEFMARIALGHDHHLHAYDLSFVAGHGHDHIHEELEGLRVATDGYQDAHELAHANDIRRKFADRRVTNWQIVLFGLTGGLIPARPPLRCCSSVCSWRRSRSVSRWFCVFDRPRVDARHRRGGRSPERRTRFAPMVLVRHGGAPRALRLRDSHRCRRIVHRHPGWSGLAAS